MFKKFFSAAVMVCLFIFGANVCAAGTFQIIYNSENFTENLKNDEAVDETFNTNDGKLRLQLRKLKNAKSDEKMHVLGWLKDKRVYDEHFPDVMNGYTFRVIKNTADSRQFYVIQSIDRALLIGWSPAAQKMETYIDSMNYAHEQGAYPYIIANVNGDLILAFENPSHTRSARFRFTWNNDKQWFGYSDLGVYRYPVMNDIQK